jgi:hypothetical protein
MKFRLSRIFPALVLSASLAVAAAPSRAATISHMHTQTLLPSGTVGSVSFDPVNSTTHSGAYALQLFDTSLGTLNSVRLQIDQGISSNLDFGSGTCNDVQGGSDCLEVTREGNQTATYTAGATANAALANQAFFHVDLCSAPGGTGTPADPPCFNGFAQNFQMLDDTLLTGSQTDDFEGTGNFTIDTEMFFQYANSTLAGGRFDTDTHFSWSGTATVTYDYTANATEIPAPAGAAFLLIGVAALARVRRFSAG